MRISDWSSDVCSSDLKRRIRGVQIFGLTRAQYPPTKSNHAPSCIADRNHQSAAKPVIAFAFAIWIDQEPRFDEPQLAVALQRLFQPSAPIGRQTDAEGLCVRRAQPAPLDIVARVAALYACPLCSEPVLRRPHSTPYGGRLFCLFCF